MLKADIANSKVEDALFGKQGLVFALFHESAGAISIFTCSLVQSALGYKAE
jgi:hypothetical protein